MEVCAIHSFIHAAVTSVIHSSSEYCRPTVKGGSWVWETDWDPNKKALSVRTRGSGFGLWARKNHSSRARLGRGVSKGKFGPGPLGALYSHPESFQSYKWTTEVREMSFIDTWEKF